LSRNQDTAFEELAVKMKERSQRILERFGQVSVSGVNYPQLLSFLADVKTYWKDNFRPALTSFSCEAVGGQPEATDDVSLIITVVGAGLGIHDDIIDKSLNKHFRMTILGLHGLDNALLVGDLLIIKSWATVRGMIEKTYEPKKIMRVIEAYESFFIEICEAEFMEVSCRRNLDTDLEYYQKILWKSTADTEACARLGAILGDGSSDEVQALAEFGRRLGFTFRLLDDVKDSLNMEGSLPHRLQYESVPLPILYAAKSSKEKFLKINSILENSPITSLDVSELLQICFETNAFMYVYDIAKQNAKESAKKLRLLRSTEARNILSLMNKKSLADIASICCKFYKTTK
jgi:geranylgeranyl diphosphate synthase type I